MPGCRFIAIDPDAALIERGSARDKGGPPRCSAVADATPAAAGPDRPAGRAGRRRRLAAEVPRPSPIGRRPGDARSARAGQAAPRRAVPRAGGALARRTRTASWCATAARSGSGRRRCCPRAAASSTAPPAPSARRSRSPSPPAPPTRSAPVIAVMGDGTFGFHMAEFDTAVRCGLPFVAVVGNDANWNAEHQIQLREYGPDARTAASCCPRATIWSPGAGRPRRAGDRARGAGAGAGARPRQRQASLRQRDDRAGAGACHQARIRIKV